MSANAGERNLLLDCDAEVRTVQHERQMVQRWRNHRIRERGHDRRTRLSCPRARAGRLDLVSALAGDPDDVGKSERRGQRLRLLGKCDGG
jgi:hypothetical protein